MRETWLLTQGDERRHVMDSLEQPGRAPGRRTWGRSRHATGGEPGGGAGKNGAHGRLDVTVRLGKRCLINLGSPKRLGLPRWLRW